VVAGAGFSGLTAVSEFGRLRRRHRFPAGRKVRVTLVDQNAYSTFQPLLYQVATAGLTAADVAGDEPAHAGVQLHLVTLLGGRNRISALVNLT
jgi:NADH dehydrogenase FAD-containing subunit